MAAEMHRIDKSLLIAINRLINETFSEYRKTIFSARRFARKALAPHKAILEAIRSGDAEAGVKQMVTHVRISLEDIAFLRGNSDPPEDRTQP